MLHISDFRVQKNKAKTSGCYLRSKYELDTLSTRRRYKFRKQIKPLVEISVSTQSCVRVVLFEGCPAVHYVRYASWGQTELFKSLGR